MYPSRRDRVIREALATFVDVLRWWASTDPARHAFSFLPDGTPDGEISLDYGELDRQARVVAGMLQERGSAGERALLAYPPGLAFVAAVFGCMYAGWVAVPAQPPAPNQRGRLRGIARHARPAAALTIEAMLARAKESLSEDGDAVDLPWLATDTLPPGLADDWRELRLEPDALALLQYTSGSTGAPHGVMLSHANLLHNTCQIHRRFEIHEASRGVIWLPAFHDMGLIGGILQGVEVGGPTTLIPPAAFLRRPVRWLDAISREQATISGGPNFAYDLCVERIGPEERARLDLSSWEVAFTGAEPVRRETLDRFVAAFGPSGFRKEAFYPCYGLAEATLMVSGGVKSEPPSVLTVDSSALAAGEVVVVRDGAQGASSIVGCGQPIDGACLAIVDPAAASACEEDRVGEIWVTGPSVAKGYWEDPELTRETFFARPTDSPRDWFVRTGDLGFVHAGELFVTGRLKTVLIVNGRNVQAEDIEHTVATSHDLSWPGGVAAVSLEVEGRELLAIFQEIDSRRAKSAVDLPATIRAIRLGIAEQHQLAIDRVVLARPGTIPRTSSGKVQRDACREAYVAGQLDVLIDWTSGRGGAWRT